MSLTVTTATRPALRDDGAGATPSLPPPRPASPRLGNFDAIFNLCFGPASDETAPSESAEPVKALRPPGPPLPKTEHLPTPSNVPRAPTYNVGFLRGLDLSAIESPSATPVSLVLDFASENDDKVDGEKTEVEDEDEDDEVDELLRKESLLSTSPQVVIASASSSPTTPAAARSAAVAVAASSLKHSKTKRAAGFDSAAQTVARAAVFAGAVSPAIGLFPGATPFLPGSAPVSNFVPAPFPVSYMVNNLLQPVLLNPRQERLDMIEAKLKHEYKRDRSISISNASSTSPEIHVFVDLSNIVIGFYSRIRADRNIPPETKMRAPPFFFEGFARILERGRTAARRVTAGSAPDNNNRLSWPVYMREAEALGYEMNILSRVTKSVPSPKIRPSNKQSGYKGHRKNASRSNADWAFSSDVNSSGDEAFGPSSPRPPSTFKIGEQAVDEILHLKMCHSFLDHDPGTIVLATGDAAEAEFSDGFLKHVERALGRGWCVELLSWKMGISYAWRELERQQKGTGRFRIIELDKYSEDLLALFSD